MLFMLTRRFSVVRGLLILVFILLGTACSNNVRLDEAERLPADALYAEAKRSLDNGSYDRAVKFYQRLVARFPYGSYHEQGQIDLAYALYERGKHEEALSAANRFIKLYPTHPRIDYAYYLRGLVNFNRQAGFLERYFRSDLTRRDLQYIRQSFQDFAELVEKFPNSSYAPDARQRMIYLRNGLAQGEIMVAGYYLRRGAWVASAQRAKFVLETYQESPQTGDALAIMTESYRRLGQTELADDASKVLKQNYPEHPYFAGNWPAKQSAWRKLVPFMNSGRSKG
jgi:outer membrane protein assembly factor BamD